MRTDDERPAKADATQVEPLIEVVRATLDRTQNGGVSVRKTWGELALCTARISATQADDMGGVTADWGRGGRDEMRRGGGRIKMYLAAFSAPTVVDIFLIERVCWSVLLKMTGKELHSNLIDGAGHSCGEERSDGGKW